MVLTVQQVCSFEYSLANVKLGEKIILIRRENKEMTTWMFSGYQGNHMVQNDWVEGKLEDAVSRVLWSQAQGMPATTVTLKETNC